MPAVSDVLAAPGVRPHVEVLVGEASNSQAASVALVEDASALDGASEGAVVVLTSHASAPAATYRFDIALRVARNRRLAALIVSGPSFSTVSSTAAAIARRSGITIARATPGTDLARLCVQLAHEIDGPANVALERAHQSLSVIIEDRQAPAPDLVEATAQELGLTVRVCSEPRPDDVCVPIDLDGEVAQWLCHERPPPNMAIAARLVCHVLANEIAHRGRIERAAEEAPIQSRAELLTQLLDARGEGSSQLVRRARALDIPVDGWHIATQFEFDHHPTQAASDEVAAFETRQAIARVALETARSSGGEWYSARVGAAMVLVRMHREDPGAAGVTSVLKAAERVLQRIGPRLENAVIRCGVGSLHSGGTGLVSTAAEARAAVAAARAADHANVATAFDSMGLRRTLLEWYAGDSARDAVAQILAPLDQLEGRRAETALRTLQTYLDHRGSTVETARALGLHRNAIPYRIKNIFSLLDADPDNPDDWLLLQLACRARNLRLR